MIAKSMAVQLLVVVLPEVAGPLPFAAHVVDDVLAQSLINGAHLRVAPVVGFQSLQDEVLKVDPNWPAPVVRAHAEELILLANGSQAVLGPNSCLIGYRIEVGVDDVSAILVD